jgi:beta-glucosidase
MKKEEIPTGRVGSMLNVLHTAQTRAFQKVAVIKTRPEIALIIAYDVIHGYKTMFPIPLGEVAIWDVEALEASARSAAREASAAGIHRRFGPVVDIVHDARWGRIMEGAGEGVPGLQEDAI